VEEAKSRRSSLNRLFNLGAAMTPQRLQLVRGCFAYPFVHSAMATACPAVVFAKTVVAICAACRGADRRWEAHRGFHRSSYFVPGNIGVVVGNEHRCMNPDSWSSFTRIAGPWDRAKTLKVAFCWSCFTTATEEPCTSVFVKT
jgi:hypothetical protein